MNSPPAMVGIILLLLSFTPCTSLADNTGRRVAQSSTFPRGAQPSQNHLPNGWDFIADGGFGEYLYADREICQELKAYMNKVARTWVRKPNGIVRNYCASSAINAPFFKQPEWKELDPQTYLVLIARLLRYEKEGNGDFLADEDRKLKRSNDSIFEEKAREFIRLGGRVRYLRTNTIANLKQFPTVELGEVMLEEQNIIQLEFKTDIEDERAKAPGASYVDCPASNWVGEVFYVNDELTAPIPVTSHLMNYSNLLVYKGGFIFLSGDQYRIDIYDANEIKSGEYCALMPSDKFLVEEK